MACRRLSASTSVDRVVDWHGPEVWILWHAVGLSWVLIIVPESPAGRDEETLTELLMNSENYLQNNPTDLIPGALGLGKSRATTVNSAFTVLVNVLPFPSSVLVDGRLGRYRSLQLFTAWVFLSIFLPWLLVE